MNLRAEPCQARGEVLLVRSHSIPSATRRSAPTSRSSNTTLFRAIGRARSTSTMRAAAVVAPGVIPRSQSRAAISRATAAETNATAPSGRTNVIVSAVKTRLAAGSERRAARQISRDPRRLQAFRPTDGRSQSLPELPESGETCRAEPPAGRVCEGESGVGACSWGSVLVRSPRPTTESTASTSASARPPVVA